MDIQGYTPRSEEPKTVHYVDKAESFDMSPFPEYKRGGHSPLLTPTSIPTGLSSLAEGVSSCFSTDMASTKETDEPDGLVNPSLLLSRYDKRKSSPAIFNLDGLSNDEQLSTHLSQPRNSIDAAILLASFNRLSAENKVAPSHWQDDMSIPALTQGKWQDNESLPEAESARRYSYDVHMSWNSMPQDFLERNDLLHNVPSSVPSETNTSPAKITWMGGIPEPGSQPPLSLSSTSPPTSGSSENLFMHPLANGPSSSSQASYPYPPPPPPGTNHSYYSSSSSSSAVPVMPSPPPLQYYFPPPHGKLPFPSSMMDPAMLAPPRLPHPPMDMPTGSAPKRKRPLTDLDGRDAIDAREDLTEASAEHPDPDKADAKPRRQKLKFDGDRYTPQWVRYNSQAKEGLCDTCVPGKWLQLKNSAYWYHKQFYHGISSVSGKEFIEPLETRWVDQDLLEGLCHQCKQWVAVSNVKRRNSVLWYRHAHKCHVYHKPKGVALPKKR